MVPKPINDDLPVCPTRKGCQSAAHLGSTIKLQAVPQTEVTAVHRMKAKHRPLRQEGPQQAWCPHRILSMILHLPSRIANPISENASISARKLKDRGNDYNFTSSQFSSPTSQLIPTLSQLKPSRNELRLRPSSSRLHLLQNSHITHVSSLGARAFAAPESTEGDASFLFRTAFEARAGCTRCGINIEIPNNHH
jgi:hypothetical protein